jgi:hypothetical protein
MSSPEEPGAAATAGAAVTPNAHPLGKHLEISGIRVTETGNRRLQVRMVVVNHSAAELPDMKLAVSLRSVKAAPGDEPVSKFNVTLPSLGAFQSVDVKADTATKLRAYEFPDWQFLTADFEVTSP